MSEHLATREKQQVDPALVLGWLTARSVARGLPLPICERGGFYVHTNCDTELQRWVFPQMCQGLKELGRELTQPRNFLKLCGSSEELRNALPAHWDVAPARCFMRLMPNRQIARALPAGYAIECRHDADAIHVQINAPDGSPAASGHGAAAEGVFAYDRIQTAVPHRRKGLGSAVIGTLAAHSPRDIEHHLLVATEDGHKLYTALGATVLFSYSTAEVCPAKC
jgi:hypothetical protein